MAIFGVLELESVVQTNDKTRLDARKTFVSTGNAPITKIRIQPEAAASYVELSAPLFDQGQWFADWQFGTDGAKVVTLEVTTTSSDTIPVVTVQTFTKTIEVLDPVDDKLFSSDAMLTGYEPDILNWVRAGRSSFLDVHRSVQYLILDWLDSIRIWRTDGSKLTKEDLSLTDDLQQLSTYWVLMNIFRGLSNKPEDTFEVKSEFYASKVLDVKNRGRIQADYDGTDDPDNISGNDMRSFRMVRR